MGEFKVCICWNCWGQGHELEECPEQKRSYIQRETLRKEKGIPASYIYREYLQQQVNLNEQLNSMINAEMEKEAEEMRSRARPQQEQKERKYGKPQTGGGVSLSNYVPSEILSPQEKVQVNVKTEEPEMEEEEAADNSNFVIPKGRSTPPHLRSRRKNTDCDSDSNAVLVFKLEKLDIPKPSILTKEQLAETFSMPTKPSELVPRSNISRWADPPKEKEEPAVALNNNNNNRSRWAPAMKENMFNEVVTLQNPPKFKPENPPAAEQKQQPQVDNSFPSEFDQTTASVDVAAPDHHRATEPSAQDRLVRKGSTLEYEMEINFSPKTAAKLSAVNAPYPISPFDDDAEKLIANETLGDDYQAEDETYKTKSAAQYHEQYYTQEPENGYESDEPSDPELVKDEIRRLKEFRGDPNYTNGLQQNTVESGNEKKTTVLLDWEASFDTSAHLDAYGDGLGGNDTDKPRPGSQQTVKSNQAVQKPCSEKNKPRLLDKAEAAEILKSIIQFEHQDTDAKQHFARPESEADDDATGMTETAPNTFAQNEKTPIHESERIERIRMQTYKSFSEHCMAEKDRVNGKVADSPKKERRTRAHKQKLPANRSAEEAETFKEDKSHDEMFPAHDGYGYSNEEANKYYDEATENILYELHGLHLKTDDIIKASSDSQSNADDIKRTIHKSHSKLEGGFAILNDALQELTSVHLRREVMQAIKLHFTNEPRAQETWADAGKQMQDAELYGSDHDDNGMLRKKTGHRAVPNLKDMDDRIKDTHMKLIRFIETNARQPVARENREILAGMAKLETKLGAVGNGVNMNQLLGGLNRLDRRLESVESQQVTLQNQNEAILTSLKYLTMRVDGLESGSATPLKSSSPSTASPVFPPDKAQRRAPRQQRNYPQDRDDRDGHINNNSEWHKGF